MSQASRFALIICVSILFVGCASRQGSDFIEVQEWMDGQPFALHFLWPLPNGFKPIEPPRFVQGADSAYVWAWYSEGEPVNGIEPPIYMIYESSVLLDPGEDILSEYTDDKTIKTFVEVSIQGQDRNVELRDNPAFEDSGVALFTIDGTHIAFHWRHIGETEALQTIRSHLLPLKDHPALIQSIEDHIRRLSDSQRR